MMRLFSCGFGFFLGMCLFATSAQSQDVGKAFYARDFNTGRVLAESAWRMAKGRGKMVDAAVASANVGACLTMLGQFDDARMWQQRAQDILSKQSPTSLVGKLNVARAVTAFLEGQQYGTNKVADAIVYLNKAEGILEQGDGRLALVDAEIRALSGDAVLEAEGYRGYVALIDYFEQSGDRLAMARCAVRLARLDGKRGADRMALQRCLTAADVFEKAGEMGEVAFALRNAGHAHRKLGAYVPAETFLKKALDAAQENGQASVVLRVLDDLSRLYAEMDRYEQAIDFDRQADALLHKIAESVPQGYAADSVSLSFQHLLLLRFASLLPYEADLFAGFYDALVLQVAQ
ncbi:MAG: tetratricopeptide repeat protein [Candidatus Latescibacteria bacterium]|nr:tetratricopeptide repeat protein [Candidatus Latescibacterota bacterium]